jgi:hypothetical protein
VLRNNSNGREVVFLLLNGDVDHGEKDAAEKMAGHLLKA